VSPPTRLDAVVRLREVDEDRARSKMAEAQRLALATQAAVREAAARALADDRRRGSADDWSLIESAHIRALADARQAERDKMMADEKLGQSRQRFVGARTRAEAMRRVRESRLSEIRTAERLGELKQMDEVATVLHGRR
jgi:flagellar export protein FliJ